MLRQFLRRYARYALHLLLIALGLYTSLYFIQRKLLFCGTPHLAYTPAAYRLPFEPFVAHGDGAEVHGWFLPVPGARGVVLFCHGGGGNIAEHFDPPRHMLARGVSVASFDYAGSGESPGRASESRMYRDTRAAWDYLVHDRGIPPSQIVIWGQSFGCGPACDLASHVQPAGLILEAGFYSLAREYLGTPGAYLGWLIPCNFNNASKIGNIQTPLLMVHSADDEVYSMVGARALYTIAHEPKEFLATVGSHYAFPSTPEAHAEYDKTMNEFLGRVLNK